jgi:hypothetical protein
VGGTGCIDTVASTGILFSGGTLGAGIAGNIQNLVIGGGSVDQFMTFPTAPALDFALTGITPPTPTNGTNCGALTIGESCVVSAGSPFLLGDFGTQTAMTLSVFGTVSDGVFAGAWSGSFSTQLNVTPGSIQTVINGGGSISVSYAGSFNAFPDSVPEPALWTLTGGALITFAVAAKRRRPRL